MLGSPCNPCCSGCPTIDEECLDENGTVPVKARFTGIEGFLDGKWIPVLLEERPDPDCDLYGVALLDCGVSVSVTIEKRTGYKRVEIGEVSEYECPDDTYIFEEESEVDGCESLSFAAVESLHTPGVFCDLEYGAADEVVFPTPCCYDWSDCVDAETGLYVTVTFDGISDCVDGKEIIASLQQVDGVCELRGDFGTACSPAGAIIIRKATNKKRCDGQVVTVTFASVGEYSGSLTFRSQPAPTDCDGIGFTADADQVEGVSCTLSVGGEPPGHDFAPCPVEIVFGSDVTIGGVETTGGTIANLCGSDPPLTGGPPHPDGAAWAKAQYNATDWQPPPFGKNTTATVWLGRLCHPLCGWYARVDQTHLVGSEAYIEATWFAASEESDLPAFGDLEFEMYSCGFTFQDDSDPLAPVARSVSLMEPISDADQAILDQAIEDEVIGGVPDLPALAEYTWA